MLGGNGHDLMFGMNGNDRMYGGAGDDSFHMFEATAPGDADYISGGSGARDAVTYITYEKPITADADGVTGDDGAKGEHDTIAGDIEEIQGGGGDDHLYGTGRDDYLYGWEGNDVIRGGGGDDLVAGEGGRDWLYGETGDDYVSGSETGDPQARDRLDGGANRTAPILPWGAGEDDEALYLSSADWMSRNMLRRIELAWPVRDAALRQRVIDECLLPYLHDGRDAWLQQSDGRYERVGSDGPSAQQALLALKGAGG